MFVSCRIEKFSVQLKIDPNKERGSKEGKKHYPLRISTPDSDMAASSRAHHAVDANPWSETRISEFGERSEVSKNLGFQRTSGEDRMKSSCHCWLEAKRWMAKDLETLPSPFSNALNSSLKLFLLPFPSRSQMFPGSISELCAVSHTLGCSWMGLMHQRNFCNFLKNTVQVRVWHQRSSSTLHWVQLRGAVPKIIELCKPRLLFPFADRRKLRGFSSSVRRPLQITAPNIAKVS